MARAAGVVGEGSPEGSAAALVAGGAETEARASLRGGRGGRGGAARRASSAGPRRLSCCGSPGRAARRAGSRPPSPRARARGPSSHSPAAGCGAVAGEACRDDDSTCVGSECADRRRPSLQDAAAVDEGGAGSWPRTPRGARAEAPAAGAGGGLSRGRLAAALGSVFLSLAVQGGARPHADLGFDSLSEPRITVHAYLRRLAEHFDCSDECLVAGLMYIDRLGKMHSAFVVSPLNVHRVVLASVVLAAKFWDDHYYSNRHYAAAGGVRLEEMNSLEFKFLRLIRWQLTILPEEFQIYQNLILDVAKGLPAARRTV